MRRYSAYSPSPLARRTPASRYNRHGDSFLDNNDDDNKDDHGHVEPLTSRPKTTRRRIVKGVKGLTPTNFRGGRGARGFEREPAATATTTPRPATPARIGRSRSRSLRRSRSRSPSRVPPDENDAGNSRRGRSASKAKARTAVSAGGVQKAKGGHQKHRRRLVDENEEQSDITISSSSDFESDTSSSDESAVGTHSRRQPPSAAEDFGILANQFVHLLKSSMSQGCLTEEGIGSNRRNSTKQLMSRKQRKMVSRKKKKNTTLESYDDESSSTSCSSDEAFEYAKQVIKKRLSKSTEGTALGSKSSGRPRRLNQLRVSTMHTEEEEQTEVPDDGHSHNPSREGRRNITPHYKLSSRNYEDEVTGFGAPPPRREPLRARSSDRHSHHHQHPISRRSFNGSVRVDDEHSRLSRSHCSNNMRHRCHSSNSRFVDGMRVPDVPEVCARNSRSLCCFVA